MRITPLDIRKQEFRKVMRGVDSEEVYAFLTTVAEEYEAALSDNKALRERVLELDDKVQEYRTLERTLRDTLLTAERATADAKQNAQREADLIIKEAQIEAEKTLRDIRNQMMKLRQEVQTLQRERESYLARMRMLAESFVRFIDSEERQFSDDEKKVAKITAEPESREIPPSPTVEKLETSTVEAPSVDAPRVEPLRTDPPHDETDTHKKSSGEAPALPRTIIGTTEASSESIQGKPSPPPQEPRSKETPAPKIQNDRLQKPALERPMPRMEPPDKSETVSSAKTVVPDLNAILDRMVKEQKEILNETADRRDAAGPGSGADVYQPAGGSSTVSAKPPAQRDAPPRTADREKSEPLPAQKQPVVKKEPQKEWSLDKLKKDIISE